MRSPRHSAHCVFSVSKPSPVCSMSNSANSAPAFTQSYGRPGVKNSNTIAPNACPPAASVVLTGLSRSVTSMRPWRVSRGVDLVALDGSRYGCSRQRALPRQRGKRRDDYMPAIVLEETAQCRARVAATEAIGAQCHEAAADVRRDQLRVRANVVGGGDDRRRSAEAALQVALAGRGARLQPVGALDVACLAGELAEARHAPDFARHLPIVTEHRRGGDDFTQDRTGPQQPCGSGFARRSARLQ